MGFACVETPSPKLWAETECGAEVRVPRDTMLGTLVDCGRGCSPWGNRPRGCRVRLLSSDCKKQRETWVERGL